MPAAADSDNESVLSSLPSSPPADELDRDGHGQLSLSEGDEEDGRRAQRNESDAETEPLAPASSAARARQKRRPILHTESSSSEPETAPMAGHGNADDGPRRRDTLAVPSGSSQLPAMHSPKSRRMSFDDGSDLSALTSDADDAPVDEDGDDEDADENEGGAPTPRASRNVDASSSSSQSKSDVIGQRQPASARSDRQSASDIDDDELEDGDDTASMDEDGDDNEAEEQSGEEIENGSLSGRHARGRGRPPKRQNALAAAAKRAAARTSSLGKVRDGGDSTGASESTGHVTEAEPVALDGADGDADSASQAAAASLAAKIEQIDSVSLSGTNEEKAEDEDEDLDPDEQLRQDMLADEAEELAKAARALDDSDDEDYMDPSGPKSRSQQQPSARRRGQIHSGTAKNATRRVIAGQGALNAPRRGGPTTEGDLHASLPSSPAKVLSPTNRNAIKGPNSASSLSAKKRGGYAKRGAAGRAAAAALRNNSSAARVDSGDDEDDTEMDSQAQVSDDVSDSDVLREGNEGIQGGSNAQITITDVNGKTELGEASFMSGSAMSLPGSVAAAGALSAAHLDREDAMSGASEDIPILLKATEQAQAQTASTSASSSIVPRLSLSTPAHQIGSLLARETATPEEEDTTAPSTPLLPVPPQSFPSSSVGRRKSPALEATVPSGRGRGRGGRGAWGRGRAKKLAQARMLAAQGDDDDIAMSAAEDGHNREGSPGHETGAGSDHDEGDDGAAKKRQEAIEALTKIEIEFAQLRDRIYLEKMEEIAKERWQIENGVHPEHIHLMHLVEQRRSARLELARKNYKVAQDANSRRTEANIRNCWSHWTRQRDDLTRKMVDDMNQKRRRLDREKRAIDRPRNEELATILRIHAPPPYMFREKKNPYTYGRDYSMEHEVAENLQKKRKRGPAGLTYDEVMSDLVQMGLRKPYSSTYPADYHYDPAYTEGPPVAGPSRVPIPLEAGRTGYNSYQYENQYESHSASAPFPQQSQTYPQHSSISPSNNPLAAAQGRTVASVSQQQVPPGISGRSDPFSAYRMQTPTGTLTPGGTPGSMHVQAPTLPHTVRAGSGPRPTLDDHLGYSATGQARPPSVNQAARPGQRFDDSTAGPNPVGEAPSNQFHPSYYTALGEQRK